ncbi:uncharacterized protein METZ01_LOCUS261297 [marine metagenome]|uniref:Uncharacterized protein n=1 Tax=marine metagenome TaxID=408172 RepID=A0A382JBG6_9ZZZZ
MKDKMTLGLVCAFFIGLAYFGSSSIETSNVETEIISEVPPVQLESESLEIINDIPSENEILNEVEFSSMNSCKLGEMDTDLLSFSEAFGYFRQCLGSDSSFQWKGSEYTTILLEEVIIQMADSVQVDENSIDTEISQIR